MNAPYLAPAEQRIIDIIKKKPDLMPQDIAAHLGVKAKTVHGHLNLIYGKLKIGSIAQLKAICNVEPQKICGRCNRSLPISAFRNPIRKSCMACVEQAEKNTMHQRLQDYLTANGPATAAKIADALGTTSKLVGMTLSARPNLFCMVGKEHNPHGPDRPVWAIVGTEPQPEPETPSHITWQHKSPVAAWILSGQVVQKKGRHFVVEANGLHYEVPEESLI
jgi:DNA-binding CsgD family transcriptional regulator